MVRRFGFLFRPKWIGFHLLVAGAVVLMFNLGFWQLHRLDARRTTNAEYIERIDQDPVDAVALFAAPSLDPALAANRRVTATGTYLEDQIVLFNRSQGGRAVDEVLTPLLLDGTDAVVLVNRGAIDVEATPPPPPSGTVEIVGRLRPSVERSTGGLSDAAQDRITEVRRVNIEELRPQLERDGATLEPMYVELLGTTPQVGPGDPELLDSPELGEGNHLSYAIQWFVFMVCVAIGWVLAVRRSLRTHALANADGAVDRTPSDSPAPVDAGSTTART